MTICKCGRLEFFIDEGKVPVEYCPEFRRYSIKLKSGSAIQVINYCPWCGDKLPDSLRDKWLAELEALGFDDPFYQMETSPDFPEKYKSDAWWKDG